MHMTVVGGTGLIGARVVRLLRDHGDEVRVASRGTGVDAYSGQGLREAFEGAQVVVDVLNMNRPSYEYEQSLSYFDTCTRSIPRAEESAGVQHHVGLSVIGAERLDSNYFRGKVAQERLVGQSPIPHSMLRTTLFYENISKLVDHVATTHMVRLPRVRVRPVSAHDVATTLCRLAHDVPLNGSFELAGPRTGSSTSWPAKCSPPSTTRGALYPMSTRCSWVHACSPATSRCFPPGRRPLARSRSGGARREIGSRPDRQR